MQLHEVKLRVHSEPLNRTREGLPALGLRQLVVRDDLGREIEVDFMAWGQLGEDVAGLFPDVQIVGERTDGVVVAPNDKTLDAGAEYLLLLVRCDGAVRDG